MTWLLLTWPHKASRHDGTYIVLIWYCIPSDRSIKCSTDSRLAPSQWETSLQSNAVFHWLGTNLESALTCDVTFHRNDTGISEVWALAVHLPWMHYFIWYLFLPVSIHILTSAVDCNCYEFTLRVASDEQLHTCASPLIYPAVKIWYLLVPERPTRFAMHDIDQTFI